MLIQTTCPSCQTTYSIEWHDFNYSMYDVENDEYEESDPTICPFCGARIDEHEDEDEDDE